MPNFLPLIGQEKTQIIDENSAESKPLKKWVSF